MTLRTASLLVLALTLGCGTAAQPQSTAPAQPASAPVAAGQPAPPAAANMPMQNANQEKNDQIARAVLERIAGHENEPAEQVFKNIQSLKGMPAGRLVRVMNMGYSRALGVGCLHCHYGPDYSSDEKRQKRAARDGDEQDDQRAAEKPEEPRGKARGEIRQLHDVPPRPGRPECRTALT